MLLEEYFNEPFFKPLSTDQCSSIMNATRERVTYDPEGLVIGPWQDGARYAVQGT
jgi:hypothetical protein